MLNYEDYQLINQLKEENPKAYNLINKISNYALQTASHGCHDLRNHAALISSYCQLLAMTNADITNDSYFQKVNLSTENLIKLFDEIAIFRYGFVINNMSDTDIRTLISDSVLYTRQTFANLSLNITTEFNGSFVCKCDPEHMRNAFKAIIKNAVEACSPENIQINISSNIKNGCIEISIQDNGDGFSDEMLENGCIPFKTDKKNHTGLGLALASTVIYKHNGNLKIANTSCGSQITIQLPLLN